MKKQTTTKNRESGKLSLKNPTKQDLRNLARIVKFANLGPETPLVKSTPEESDAELERLEKLMGKGDE